MKVTAEIAYKLRISVEAEGALAPIVFEPGQGPLERVEIELRIESGHVTRVAAHAVYELDEQVHREEVDNSGELIVAIIENGHACIVAPDSMFAYVRVVMRQVAAVTLQVHVALDVDKLLPLVESLELTFPGRNRMKGRRATWVGERRRCVA
jgi:hypothetical protein